jgi:hypothetical protein
MRMVVQALGVSKGRLVMASPAQNPERALCQGRTLADQARIFADQA